MAVLISAALLASTAPSGAATDGFADLRKVGEQDSPELFGSAELQNSTSDVMTKVSVRNLQAGKHQVVLYTGAECAANQGLGTVQGTAEIEVEANGEGLLVGWKLSAASIDALIAAKSTIVVYEGAAPALCGDVRAYP